MKYKFFFNNTISKQPMNEWMNDLLAQSKSLTMIKLFESLLQHKLNENFRQISQIR